MALIVQNFDIRLEDPNYKLVVKQALTIKPKDCYIFADIRDGLEVSQLSKRLYQGASPRPPPPRSLETPRARRAEAQTSGPLPSSSDPTAGR